MFIMIIRERLLEVKLPPGRSAFLWGPRKVGKTFYLKHHFPDAEYIDLLKTDVFAEYAARPSLLRERYANAKSTIIIDEIQLVPLLLPEVHWLIENSSAQFIMSGSSARKIRNKDMNLIGGRAWRYAMTPLSIREIIDGNLENIMRAGLLPSHFLSPDPIQDLRAYVADYLKEEIAAEARIQSIPSFSEFLHVAAVTNGGLVNYANMAREAGTRAHTVRQYFQILEDTLLGYRLQPWRKTRNRRLIETEKFYLFDVGVCNYLARRVPVAGTFEFGLAFEHLILMELKAFQAYRYPELPLAYWRTSTGLEVDFIVGEMDIAVEVKGSSRVHEADLRPLHAVMEEQTVRKAVVVSLEKQPRTIGDIEILPWTMFIDRLWAGEYLEIP